MCRLVDTPRQWHRSARYLIPTKFIHIRITNREGFRSINSTKISSEIRKQVWENLQVVHNITSSVHPSNTNVPLKIAEYINLNSNQSHSVHPITKGSFQQPMRDSMETLHSLKAAPTKRSPSHSCARSLQSRWQRPHVLFRIRTLQ